MHNHYKQTYSKSLTGKLPVRNLILMFFFSKSWQKCWASLYWVLILGHKLVQ